jgi:hypothetical protein
MTPRSYNSLDEVAVEIFKSRVYAGIHYIWSVEKGLERGKKVAQNILRKVKFLKE